MSSKATDTKLQTPIVELEWTGDPAPFYCPVCGKVVFAEGSDVEFCDHIIFTYLDIVGDIDTIPEKLQNKAVSYLVDNGTITEEADFTPGDYLGEVKFDDFLTALSHAIDSPSSFIVSLTTNGVGCGPCSSTVVVGVDFNPKS